VGEPAILDHPAAVPGWFHHGPKILELVDQHQPKVCVELGTWLGASAIPVALAIARWRGVLTCVDTWSDNIYRAGDTSPWLLLNCARNLVGAGVSNVRLMPTTTLDAARTWTEPIDCLYVDADHSYEAVRADLEAWVPHVKPGGLILGDDYGNEAFPGVAQAWDEFEQRWWMRDPKHGALTLTRYQSDPPHPDGVQLIYGTV
jgi:predicted O-methyltransferase YrrM